MNRCQSMMGTYVEVYVKGQNDQALSLTTQILSEMRKIEACMNYFDQQSELTSVNEHFKNHNSKPITICKELSTLLQLAKHIFDLTGGVFDCAVKGSIASLKNLENRTIWSTEPIEINLGGIAKGFAVDMGMDVLKKAKSSGMINAGGDLAVYGDEFQPIWIAKDGVDNVEYLLSIKNGAVATSAQRRRSLEVPENEPLHLRNPKTGKYVQSDQTFSVLAPTCCVADALTKVLAIEQNVHAPYWKALSAIPYIRSGAC